MSENCDEALTSLFLFIDREMPGEDLSRIKQHLTDCPPCEGRFEFESRLKQVVRDRLQEDVPESVLARFRIALRESRHPSS